VKRAPGIDWLIIYGFTSRSRIFHLYGDISRNRRSICNADLYTRILTIELSLFGRGTESFNERERERERDVCVYINTYLQESDHVSSEKENFADNENCVLK
jgi:hypothetical protein